jgi:biotin carboxyl carrier protein
MPGKILKIENKIGQKIKLGQTVCVIEAMKMEYALKAPFEGKIKDVFKNAGDQVLLNEKVMLLEEVK